MPIPRELIDPDADKVVRRLRRQGHEAYLVGGCVRDLLLGRTPKDFDVATSATPPEIRNVFRNCRIIGRRFRLAHVFWGQKIIETSTFRANPREGEPEPAEDEDLLIRRDNVFGTAEEDARRRDFTINALFYDVEAAEVIDFVDGLADLDARLIRTIGDPEIRLREDPVRILRAVRFAARLGFGIEPATLTAIHAHRDEIRKCARPRVVDEIYKFLRGGSAVASLEGLLSTGVLGVLSPLLLHLLAGGGGGEFPGLPEEQIAPRRALAWRALAELDRMATSGEIRRGGPANAVVLGALASAFVPPPGQETRGGDLIAALDAVVRPLGAEFGAARRDTEAARQMLLFASRLRPGGRRRGRATVLGHRDGIHEALQLAEIQLRALGLPTVELDRFRRAAPEPDHAADEPGQAPGEPGRAPDEPAAPGAEPRRRRHRRGGRGRRRAEGAAPVEPAATPPPEIPEP